MYGYTFSRLSAEDSRHIFERFSLTGSFYFVFSPYECGVCGASFTTQGSVQRHMVSHQVPVIMEVSHLEQTPTRYQLP
jgi:hypothetical protein